MVHPLVAQLRFTRSEFVRCMAGVGEEEACRRFEPMNCLSWMVGHLADQENRFWLKVAQGKEIRPELNALVGFQKPPSTPPLEEMWRAWRQVTTAADPYLDTLTPDVMATHLVFRNKPMAENVGTMLLRNIHHYWYHIGEASAVRQLLGHKELPQFVGDMTAAGYRPEKEVRVRNNE